MANTLVTPTWVVNETAYQFMNSVKGVPNFNRTYDDQRFSPLSGLNWRPHLRNQL